MIGISWALMLSLDSWVAIAIALMVFFSRAIPVNLLFLFTMTLIAYIQAMLGGQKSGSAGTQKRFVLLLVGLTSALFGTSISGYSPSLLFIFFGLILFIPNGFTTLFFNRHYERLTLRSYVQSVVLPAFVALDILLKIKTDVKAEYAGVWEITLMGVGLFTFLYSTVLAWAKTRLKQVLIHLSQAWIGLALFLLTIDSNSINRAVFTAIAIGTVGSIVLLSLSAQLGPRHFSFAKIATLGLPGTIWFTAWFFSLKMAIGMNILWLLVLGLGYLIQAITLISRESVPPFQEGRRVKIRFWITVMVQLVTGAGLYWLEMGGMK